MKPASDDIPDKTDEDLIAYLDGELDEAKARAVEDLLAKDPKSRQKLKSYKKTWELLEYLPKVEPSRGFTEKTLEKIEPLPVPAPPRAANSGIVAAARSQTIVPASPAAGKSRFPRFLLAASVLIGLAAGFFGKAWVASDKGSIFVSKEDLNRDKEAKEAETLRLMPLLQNLHLYKYVDDYEMLKALDSPKYFGDDAGQD